MIELVKFFRLTVGKIRVCNCFLKLYHGNDESLVDDGEIEAASLLEVKFGMLEMHLENIRLLSDSIFICFNEKMVLEKQGALKRQLAALSAFQFGTGELALLNSIEAKTKRLFEIEEVAALLFQTLNLQIISTDKAEDYIIKVFSFPALLDQVFSTDAFNKKSVNKLLEILNDERS
jgi:hypothetical protein